MGTYAYCRNEKCNSGLGSPSTKEILEGNIPCHQCGTKHILEPDFKNQLFLEMIERIEILEEKVL